jgi:hypothetical protein
MNLEEALSGSHELRVVVRAHTEEELLAWHETIAKLRAQEGCVSVCMYPVEAVVTSAKMSFTEGSSTVTEEPLCIGRVGELRSLTDEELQCLRVAVIPEVSMGCAVDGYVIGTSTTADKGVPAEHPRDKANAKTISCRGRENPRTHAYAVGEVRLPELFGDAQAAANELRERSGKVGYDSKLVSFLYQLMRDHVPPGVIEEVANQSVESEVEYSNGWLAQYANDIANKLSSGQSSSGCSRVHCVASCPMHGRTAFNTIVGGCEKCARKRLGEEG